MEVEKDFDSMTMTIATQNDVARMFDKLWMPRSECDELRQQLKNLVNDIIEGEVIIVCPVCDGRGTSEEGDCRYCDNGSITFDTVMK